MYLFVVYVLDCYIDNPGDGGEEFREGLDEGPGQQSEVPENLPEPHEAPAQQ